MMGSEGAALGPVRLVSPGSDARTRAALPAGVVAKLDMLEREAEDALALSRVANDRARDLRQQLAFLERRIAEAQEAARYRHDPGLADLAAERSDMIARLGPLDAARTAAEERWRNASQLAERCTKYLNLG